MKRAFVPAVGLALIAIAAFSNGSAVAAAGPAAGTQPPLSLRAAVPGLADTAWPMSRGNVRHTGLSPYRGPQAAALKWTFFPALGVEDNFRSSAAIGPDGTIYVGCHNGFLYAVRPDGKKKWQLASPQPDGSPAVASDGTIYINSFGVLYAVNPNGTNRWQLGGQDDLNVAYGSAPTVGADGTIYIGAVGGAIQASLLAINPDGTIRWRFSVPWRDDYAGYDMSSSPAIGPDGTIYVGCKDYYLYAVDPSGQEKWELNTGGLISADSPVVGSDGTIYVTTGSSSQDGRPQVSGRLLAVSAAGEQKWAFPTDKWTDFGPGIGPDGTIYVSATQDVSGGHLFAVSPQGALRWKFAIAGPVQGSPTIGSDGTVYTCGMAGAVYAVAPNGAKKWKWTIPWTMVPMADSPIIGRDGTLYVGSDDSFYAFKGPAQRTSTSMTISRSVATAKVHKAFVLKGTLSPGKLHDHCIVEMRPAGKTAWTKLTAVLTSTAKGAWSYRCVPAKRGAYEYRARFAGDSSRMASVSRVVQVVVK